MTCWLVLFSCFEISSFRRAVVVERERLTADQISIILSASISNAHAYQIGTCLEIWALCRATGTRDRAKNISGKKYASFAISPLIHRLDS